MTRIAFIVALMVALSPLDADAWLWGSKKEETGPIETVAFRVGQGRKHAHHAKGNLTHMSRPHANVTDKAALDCLHQEPFISSLTRS
jgi:hypothetical protein